MTLQEKKERLKEIKDIVYPSDQEYDEARQLEEDINLMTDGPVEQAKQEEQVKLCKDALDIPIKKERKTIFQFIADKLKGKPVTREMIEQLKLQREAAYIKRDISKAKSQTQNKFGNIMKVLSATTKEDDHKYDALIGNRDKKIKL